MPVALSFESKEDAINMLISMFPATTEAYAKQLLMKYDWDTGRAATALLDTAQSTEELQRIGSSANRESADDFTSIQGALNSLSSAPARPNSVIDLTLDDDVETSKAIQASMDSVATFGPSNRIDTNQQWAMVPSVPSNVPPVLSQEEQALNQALEASLSSSFLGVAEEVYEESLDLSLRLRKDGWPVALRMVDSTRSYVAPVLQCLLSIPAVTQRLLKLDLTIFPHTGAHEKTVNMLRLASACAFSARSYIPVDELVTTLTPELPPLNNQQPLWELIRAYYTLICDILESVPRDPSDEVDELPLTVFRGTSPEESTSGPASGETVLEVDTSRCANGTVGNDLVSILLDTFTRMQVCVTQLSQSCAFILLRDGKTALKYPSRLYMDKFMQMNMEEAAKLWKKREGIRETIEKLTLEKQNLSKWKGNDTLGFLRSTIHYFEHVASDGGDPLRREAHERSKEKLETAIKEVEAALQFLETHIKDLTTQAEALYDREDLQQYPYDLQAVIMHDGLPGRSHVYTYTRDTAGCWWKTIDSHVSEVSEDMVLNDQAGLHLGAGALLLVYTKAGSMDASHALSWSPDFVGSIFEDNVAFLGQLPPEIAALSPYYASDEGPFTQEKVVTSVSEFEP